MTTVINTPSNNDSANSGFIFGVGFVVVIALILLVIYVVPNLKNETDSKEVNVNLQLPAVTN